MVVKKNVVEVAGALSLLELVGYRTVELKGHPYLAIDDAVGIDSGMLDKAIKLLLQYQERQVEDETSQPIDQSTWRHSLSPSDALPHSYPIPSHHLRCTT